jgi:hypothetical protein
MLLQVRATMSVRLGFHEEQGQAAAAMPSSRTSTGAVYLSCDVGPTSGSYRAMTALLRYAADTWPYVSVIYLECDPKCPCLTRCVWLQGVHAASATGGLLVGRGCRRPARAGAGNPVLPAILTKPAP